jgi:hypothetical protein
MDTQTTPKRREGRTRLCFVAEDQGMSVEEMLEKATIDSVSPGICMKCDGVVDSIEPDADAGFCEECEENTVKSVLVIAGLI